MRGEYRICYIKPVNWKHLWMQMLKIPLDFFFSEKLSILLVAKGCFTSFSQLPLKVQQLLMDK